MTAGIGRNTGSDSGENADTAENPGISQNQAELAVGVVAHPQREEMATHLGRQIAADILCWDDGTHPGNHVAGCAATHLAVLAELTRLHTRWVVVLEDDAVPVPDFRKHLAGALQYAPTPVVGIYLGTGHRSGKTQQQIRQAVAAAEEQNCGWLLADCLIGSVGYALRADVLDSIIASITDREEELPLRISRWAQARSIDICYTQPSLVNHDDSASIGRPWRGPGFPDRRAWSYGTRECWCTGSVRLGYCPVWSGPAH